MRDPSETVTCVVQQGRTGWCPSEMISWRIDGVVVAASVGNAVVIISADMPSAAVTGTAMVAAAKTQPGCHSKGQQAQQQAQRALFTFGILSDVQWAPIEDGFSFHGTPRYYRDALEKSKRAISSFQKQKVDLTVHLGDIVDFHASKHGVSDQALDDIVGCFDVLETPVLHCIGNHCLYNATRSVLNEKLGIDAHKMNSGLMNHNSYFSFTPSLHEHKDAMKAKTKTKNHQQYRFIVLDGYDISVLGWPEGHPHRDQALAILNEKNPNEEKNSNSGLYGLDRRFVKFGGGISKTQLEWLEAELKDAVERGDKVILCCHLCIHPRSCPDTCLLYNYDDVLEIIEKYSDSVVASFSGHAHCYGYHYDEDKDIHYRVCEPIIETQEGEDCFGVVSIFEDRIEINGKGQFASDIWEIS